MDYFWLSIATATPNCGLLNMSYLAMTCRVIYFLKSAGYVKTLKNESTKRIIKESIYNTVSKNRESVKRIKSILSSEEEVYYFLELVLDRGLGVVIVIDRKTPELEEVVDSISTSMSIESQILEFITYEDDIGKKIHILDSLQTQAPAN